jgi:5-methylthioadenosine/S-adenosylhomocysteine deaminase
MTRSFPGMLFHTHASENRREMDAVRARCKMDNVEYFAALDVLQHNTCLAHCIWLSDREMELLEARNAKVLHCPSSNLKLGSGVARVPEMRARGITVSLGADGAPCNNSLDMFQEMRLAALIQKPQHGPESMRAEDVVEMATIEGARTLGIEREVGSLEAGKKADIVFLDLNRVWNSFSASVPGSIYSTIVHSCSPENVHSVMIDGRWVYRDRMFPTLSEDAVVRDARDQLGHLLQRTRFS